MNPNEPVDPRITTPPTRATVPVIADLLGARARSWAYALIGLAVPGLLAARAGADPLDIGLAVVAASGLGLAWSNVPRRP
jgi:hypothetical protein